MSLCLLGTITGAHGIHGWLKVALYTDMENRLELLDTVLVGKRETRVETMHIEGSREDAKHRLLKLQEVPDRNAAEALVGYSLFITDNQMLPPPEGMHYIHELIGCTIIDEETGDSRGIVKDVMLLPANDVYVVDYKGREILIPAVPDFIRNVDTVKKEIIVKPVPGLYEDEDAD